MVTSTHIKGQCYVTSSPSKESQTTWRKFGELNRSHGEEDRADIDNDSCS